MTQFVLLAGGLGNQLFQYSAAVALGADKVVFVDFIDNERRDKAGNPEILSLQLEVPVEFIGFSRRKPILQKYFLWLLGSTARPLSIRFRVATSRFILFLTNLVIKIYLHTNVQVVIEDRLNQKVRLLRTDRKSFLIGYFQSLENVTSIEKEIEHLNIARPEAGFISYLDRIQSRRVIGMHVRQGDYIDHPTFGTLSSDYFKDALSKIWESGQEVVIFSDSNVSIEKYVPARILPITSKCPTSFSGAEVLLLMSKCDKLVMSNSSLSWWAAFIGQKLGNSAYAPEPWFKSEVQSPDFYYRKWERLSSVFVNGAKSNSTSAKR
jgi:hypothetical protein